MLSPMTSFAAAGVFTRHQVHVGMMTSSRGTFTSPSGPSTTMLSPSSLTDVMSPGAMSSFSRSRRSSSFPSHVTPMMTTSLRSAWPSAATVISDRASQPLAMTATLSSGLLT